MVSIYNLRDCWSAYVKAFCEARQRELRALIARTVFVLFVELANSLNLLVREFPMGAPSPLFDGIDVVISIGAKKKVSWSDTSWVVAAMQDFQTWRNWTAMKLPRHAMRQKKSWFFGTGQLAVAGVVDRSDPEPTRFCPLDSAPEALFQSQHWELV